VPDFRDLPLMKHLPRAKLPTDEPLVLASGSPRRAQLLRAADYAFTVDPASDHAESGSRSRETAPEKVVRLAFQKAADVVPRAPSGLVLAADTLADVDGQILGKPQDEQHAEAMLRTLSGRHHQVYTGVCLWSRRQSRYLIDVVRTELRMQPISEKMLREYLDSMLWEGKAGAFGYQDGNDWLSIVGSGSESNVVGLPMERLAELLENFHALAETVDNTKGNTPLGS